MTDDTPTPANKRPLTENERHVVLRTLPKPPGGWADIDGSPKERDRARDQKRWHAFVGGDGRMRQDIVTGTVEAMLAPATRRQRRVEAALERRRTRRATR